MSSIDELLKHEEDVIAISRRVFEAFSPEQAHRIQMRAALGLLGKG